jgi:hypothetical protein
MGWRRGVLFVVACSIVGYLVGELITLAQGG